MTDMSRYISVKRFLGIAIVISIIIWCAILQVTGAKLILSWASFKHLPTVLTVDMVLFWFFVKWIWKVKWLQGWLVPFPDLNGTWKGKISSLWKDSASGVKTKSIDVALVIKQTFLNITCIVKSEESESISYVASFLIHPDTGQKQLVYSYFNKPKPSVRDRSAFHDGTVLLNIIISDKRISLEGEYWTSRKTTGEIHLEKI